MTKKNWLFVFVFIFPVTVQPVFACGICVDHSVDLFLPFILPFFPAAVLYLLSRRILCMIKKLPVYVPSPKLSRMLVFIAVVIFTLFVSLGSVFAVMTIIVFAAGWNYVKAWNNARKSIITGRKTFLYIFLGVWICSGIATVFWFFSSSRLEYQIGYPGSSQWIARDMYGTMASLHRSNIKKQLEKSCAIEPESKSGSNHGYKYYVYHAGLFYLCGKLNDPSITPCISKLLLREVNNFGDRWHWFFEDGLEALLTLDKKAMTSTCREMLDEIIRKDKFSEQTEYRRFAYILSFLIVNGERQDYEKYITVKNIKILKNHRLKDTGGRHAEYTGNGGKIGLEGLNLDLDSFGINPGDLEKED